MYGFLYDSHCKRKVSLRYKGKVTHDCCVNTLFMVVSNYTINKPLLYEVNCVLILQFVSSFADRLYLWWKFCIQEHKWHQ